MRLNIEILKERISKATEEAEVNKLAVRWLRRLAADYGKEGAAASELLDAVTDLLEIDE